MKANPQFKSLPKGGANLLHGRDYPNMIAATGEPVKKSAGCRYDDLRRYLQLQAAWRLFEDAKLDCLARPHRCIERHPTLRNPHQADLFYWETRKIRILSGVYSFCQVRPHPVR